MSERGFEPGLTKVGGREVCFTGYHNIIENWEILFSRGECHDSIVRTMRWSKLIRDKKIIIITSIIPTLFHLHLDFQFPAPTFQPLPPPRYPTLFHTTRSRHRSFHVRDWAVLKHTSAVGHVCPSFMYDTRAAE